MEFLLSIHCIHVCIQSNLTGYQNDVDCSGTLMAWIKHKRGLRLKLWFYDCLWISFLFVRMFSTIWPSINTALVIFPTQHNIMPESKTSSLIHIGTPPPSRFGHNWCWVLALQKIPTLTHCAENRVGVPKRIKSRLLGMTTCKFVLWKWKNISLLILLWILFNKNVISLWAIPYAVLTLHLYN